MSYTAIEDDLFKSKDNLAHCVSRDLNMGAGIAVDFKKKFGQVDKLKEQNAQIGEIAVIQDRDRFIFYLVTKENYRDKPTYETVRQSLIALQKYCIEHKIETISMPRIACGLDRLSWPKVKEIIKSTLTDMDVTVYY